MVDASWNATSHLFAPSAKLRRNWRRSGSRHLPLICPFDDGLSESLQISACELQDNKPHTHGYDRGFGSRLVVCSVFEYSNIVRRSLRHVFCSLVRKFGRTGQVNGNSLTKEAGLALSSKYRQTSINEVTDVLCADRSIVLSAYEDCDSIMAPFKPTLTEKNLPDQQGKV